MCYKIQITEKAEMGYIMNILEKREEQYKYLSKTLFERIIYRVISYEYI